MPDETQLYRQSWQLGGSWISTADTLKRAADKILIDYQAAYRHLNEHTSRAINSGTVEQFTLDPNIDFYCPYMLLMGYALENIIKGMIICGTGIADPTFGGAVNFADFRAINRDTSGPWRIDKHGFLNLLKATVIDNDLFSDAEKEMLKYLDKFVTWGGRYPVAKNFDPEHPHEVVCAEPIDSPLASIAAIYEKSIAEMYRLCRQYGERSSADDERAT
jgi:hypothetical protein